MEFSYGKGEYIEGDKHLSGTIVLSEHKLYMRGPNDDFTQTYIPLEKIERVVKSKNSLQVHVRPSLAYRYVALFSGEPKHISDLIKDLVQKRGLKKKFLKNEWVEAS